VYYRFQLEEKTRLLKTHMPYALNEKKRAWIDNLFFQPEYTVEKPLDYSEHGSSNPFLSFSELPVKSRYQFMLEESEYTIMGFIKGPVCRGQTALNVINDHFWVYFVDPENPAFNDSDNFVNMQSENLKLQTNYLMAKSAAMNEAFPNGMSLDQRLVWDGNGDNANAALTVFRHFDSATVVKGLVGQQPKTAWVIDYPLLERIHYLLVAGFDVYGNIGHQATTRLYMDFLRLEGEFNFLALLPQEERLRLREYWYRDASEHHKSFLFGSRAYLDQPSGIEYKTDKPLNELHDLLASHIGAALNRDYDLQHTNVPAEHREALTQLVETKGSPATIFPQTAILSVVDDNGKYHLYTLIKNTAHRNISSLFRESKNYLPEEDGFTVTRGVITAYPSVFFNVTEGQLPDFIESIKAINKDQDYSALVKAFGIRRNHPAFWHHSDQIHAAMKAMMPVNYGLLDYNRLENR
jgi:hypothetical protein